MILYYFNSGGTLREFDDSGNNQGENNFWTLATVPANTLFHESNNLPSEVKISDMNGLSAGEYGIDKQFMQDGTSRTVLVMHHKDEFSNGKTYSLYYKAGESNENPVASINNQQAKSTWDGTATWPAVCQIGKPGYWKEDNGDLSPDNWCLNAPVPSQSPTPTPTVTPSISISPTPTVTPSISISPTPSISISPTPSISITPTPTPSTSQPLTPKFLFKYNDGGYKLSKLGEGENDARVHMNRLRVRDDGTLTSFTKEDAFHNDSGENTYAEIYSWMDPDGDGTTTKHVIPHDPRGEDAHVDVLPADGKDDGAARHLYSRSQMQFSDVDNNYMWNMTRDAGNHNFLAFGFNSPGTEFDIDMATKSKMMTSANNGSLDQNVFFGPTSGPLNTNVTSKDELTFGTNSSLEVDDTIVVTLQDSAVGGNTIPFKVLSQDGQTEGQEVNSHTINLRAKIHKYTPSASINGGNDLLNQDGGNTASTAWSEDIPYNTTHLCRGKQDGTNANNEGNSITWELSNNTDFEITGTLPTESTTPDNNGNITLALKSPGGGLNPPASGSPYTTTLTITATGGLGWRGAAGKDDTDYTQTINVSVTVEAVQAGGGGSFSTSAASVPFTSSPDFDDFPDTVPATEEYFSDTDAAAFFVGMGMTTDGSDYAGARDTAISWGSGVSATETNKWAIYQACFVINGMGGGEMTDTLTAVPDLTLDKFGSNDVTDTLMYNMTQSHQFYTTKGGTQGTTVNPPAGVAWGNGLAYVMDVNGDNLVGFELFNGKSTSDTMADATGGSTASDLNNPIQATIGLNYYLSETTEETVYGSTPANSEFTTSRATYDTTTGSNFTSPTSYTRNVTASGTGVTGNHTFIKKTENI